MLHFNSNREANKSVRWLEQALGRQSRFQPSAKVKQTYNIPLAQLPVFRVLKVKPCSSIPFAPLISVSRNATIIFEELAKMHKIPRHKRCVAIGKIVVKTGAIVAIAGARTG